MRNQRHCSLDDKVSNTYLKFYVWNLHTKRDMYILLVPSFLVPVLLYVQKDMIFNS